GATDAGDRPGADDQPAPAYSGRGDGRPGPLGQARDLALPGGDQGGGSCRSDHRQERAGAASACRPPLSDRARPYGLERIVRATGGSPADTAPVPGTLNGT